MRGARAKGRFSGQRSISRSVAARDHLRVALDRLAVEGRQQQLALAHVALADRGEDRAGAEDRPQRRLAGQRGRQLGLGGEERADVVGMAGDHGAARHRGPHAEGLAEAAAGAEDVLDLALVEAQHLGGAGQRDDRRLAAAPRARPASIGPAGEGGASPTRSGKAGCRGGGRSATAAHARHCHRDRCNGHDFRVRCVTLYSATDAARQADEDHRHGRAGELGERDADAPDRGRRRRLPPQLLPRRPRPPRAHGRGDPRRRRAGRARGRGARRPAGAEAADRRAARRRRRAGDRHAREVDPAARSRATGRRSRSPGRA